MDLEVKLTVLCLWKWARRTNTHHVPHIRDSFMEELGGLLTHKHNTNRIVFTQIHVEQDRQHLLQFPPGRFESLQQRQPGIYICRFSYLSFPERFSPSCCCSRLAEMLAVADFMKLSVEQFNKSVNKVQSQNMNSGVCFQLAQDLFSPLRDITGGTG